MPPAVAPAGTVRAVRNACVAVALPPAADDIRNRPAPAVRGHSHPPRADDGAPFDSLAQDVAPGTGSCHTRSLVPGADEQGVHPGFDMNHGIPAVAGQVGSPAPAKNGTVARSLPAPARDIAAGPAPPARDIAGLQILPAHTRRGNRPRDRDVHRFGYLVVGRNYWACCRSSIFRLRQAVLYEYSPLCHVKRIYAKQGGNSSAQLSDYPPFRGEGRAARGAATPPPPTGCPVFRNCNRGRWRFHRVAKTSRALRCTADP